MQNQYLLGDLTLNWPCRQLLFSLEEKSFPREAQHGKESTTGDLTATGTQMTQTFFAWAHTWCLRCGKHQCLTGKGRVSLWLTALASPNRISKLCSPCGKPAEQEQGRLKGRSGTNLKIELLWKIDWSVQRISISVQQDSSFSRFLLYSKGHYHFKGPKKLLASRTSSIISLQALCWNWVFLPWFGLLLCISIKGFISGVQSDKAITVIYLCSLRAIPQRLCWAWPNLTELLLCL